MSPEAEARRTAAAAVLADFRRALASAPLGSPPGREWMFRLADALESVLGAGAENTRPDLVEVLGRALADAAGYREARGSDSACADCEASPSGLCYDHAGDLDRADAYRDLARQLGLEVTP